MPDSDALIRLRKRIESALAPTAVLRSSPWVDPRPMRTAVRAVEQAFDAVDAAPPTQSMRMAVLAFLQSSHPVTFKELKYACFGLTLPFDGVRSRLVDRDGAFTRLLVEVDGQRGETRRFRRCYQALLQSYFAYQAHEGQAPSQEAEPAFTTLRTFLTDRLELVARPSNGRVPGWVLTLKEHDNLLTDRPCDRYAGQLALGKTDLLAEVCAGLDISRESWVWQEVILAYLREICGRDDDGFKSALVNALDLAEGRTDLLASKSTSRTVVSAVVSRYSNAKSHPEHPRLRDACIVHIGNPWIRRAAWDAWVRHEPARQMVDGWLKSKLMEDFFTLLSDQGGGAVDKRRLAFWLKYVDVIEDMWFVLGSRAHYAATSEFVEMRRRMAGRMLELTGTDPQNNAFVMRIGNHLIIEYGMKGNACYIYPADQVPFDETDRSVSIHLLKRGHNRLRHGTHWEAEFTAVLRDLIGAQPRQVRKVAPSIAPPSTTGAAKPGLGTRPGNPPGAAVSTQTKNSGQVVPPATGQSGATSGSRGMWPSFTPPKPKQKSWSDFEIEALLIKCTAYGVKYEDLRKKGGSLWVYTSPTQHPELVKLLEKLGFSFTSKRGYWLEGED